MCCQLQSLGVAEWNQYIPELADSPAGEGVLRRLLLEVELCASLQELSLGGLRGQDLPVLVDYLTHRKDKERRVGATLLFTLLPH